MKLVTLAKKLGACKKRLASGGPVVTSDIELLSEIQRRLNFIHDNRFKCDCPMSDQCEHIDMMDNCLLKVDK